MSNGTEIFQGGSAQIMAGGSKNPAVAAMFAAIMSQDGGTQITAQHHDGEVKMPTISSDILAAIKGGSIGF